jgi:hypothetical protein
MNLYHLITVALASVAFANQDTGGTNANIPTLEVIGNKFFYSNNGSQFYIKGIAYQQDTANASAEVTFVDPLSDADACKRDLPYLTELHTNTLRVYAINTSVSHKECMDLFANAGIYIIADLSQPSESINRDSPEWNLELYNRYTDVVDALSNYTNVLGFFAGNEVTNNKTNTAASAFVKAAVRDTKAYIREQGYRDIPVGYSSNDDAETRVALADFFACGDEDVKVDFYGINMYEWCGNSTFQGSGYADRTQEFKNLSVPIFFSEYGCNEVQPREFTEVRALYGPDMTDVWSGGIVYMYFEEENNYGLVSVSGDSVKTMDDFNYLKSELGNINPSSASSGDVVTTSLSCPAQASTWKASTDLPQTPEEAVCDCLKSSLKCVVSSAVKAIDYGDLYGVICGLIDCSAISANGTSGVYGSYSYCNDETKLSFLLNKYYEQSGSHASDCSFNGSASLESGASTASSCSAVFSNASASAAGPGSASGSRSSSTGSSSSSGTASGSSTSTGKSSGSTLKPIGSSNMIFLVTIGTAFIVGLGAITLE